MDARGCRLLNGGFDDLGFQVPGLGVGWFKVFL